MKELLMQIADELDQSVGDFDPKHIINQEIYRILMAAQAAIPAIRLTATLLDAITQSSEKTDGLE